MEMRHNYVNIGLIDELIERMQMPHIRVEMGRWDECICGHLMRIKGVSSHTLIDHTEWGAAQLNIPVAWAATLFCCSRPDQFPDRAEAIRCLEILRDEGVVDWERAMRRPVKKPRSRAKRFINWARF